MFFHPSHLSDKGFGRVPACAGFYRDVTVTSTGRRLLKESSAPFRHEFSGIRIMIYVSGHVFRLLPVDWCGLKGSI